MWLLFSADAAYTYKEEREGIALSLQFKTEPNEMRAPLKHVVQPDLSTKKQLSKWFCLVTNLFDWKQKNISKVIY